MRMGEDDGTDGGDEGCTCSFCIGSLMEKSL